MKQDSRDGCKIGTLPTNIFVYADDIVLLCPSWYAMKVLLSVLETVSYTHLTLPTNREV